MSGTLFENAPKLRGIAGDYAKVATNRGTVLIRVVDYVAHEGVTIAMTADQARALATAITAASLTLD